MEVSVSILKLMEMEMEVFVSILKLMEMEMEVSVSILEMDGRCLWSNSGRKDNSRK